MIEGLIIDITDRKRAEEALYRVSIHDDLTGIYNRRYMFERLHALIKERQRGDRNFSIAIIDLDFFKTINDTYGHPAGDNVLKEVAGMLTASFRSYDLVGRYGGEEFIAVVMNIDGWQTEKMLFRLRDLVTSHNFYFNGTSLKVTFSAGVADTRDLDSDVTVEQLIGTADVRLYLAKGQGRDRIVYK